MTEIMTSQPLSVLGRKAERDLARMQGAIAFGVARVQATAALEGARIEAVANVGRHAMLNVAMLSQAEQSLATLVPLAASRLQAIADITTLRIADIVGQAGSRVSA